MRVKGAKLLSPGILCRDPGNFSLRVALLDLDEYSQFLQVGSFVVIAGTLFFLFSRKTKYRVQIRTTVGELSVLETDDRNYAERIVKAVNEALGKIEGGASVQHRLQVDR